MNPPFEIATFTTGRRAFQIRIERRAIEKLDDISHREFEHVKSAWFETVELAGYLNKKKADAPKLKAIGQVEKLLEDDQPEYHWKPGVALTLGQALARHSNLWAAATNPDFTPQDSEHSRSALFDLLQFNSFRNLNTNPVAGLLRAAVIQAIHQNDHGFFIELGNHLGKPSRTIPATFKPLEMEILLGWIAQGRSRWSAGSSWKLPPGFRFGFCCFTDDALNDFLQYVTCSAPSWENPSFEGVRNIRQKFKKLHLTRPRRIAVKRVHRDKAGCIWLS